MRPSTVGFVLAPIYLAVVIGEVMLYLHGRHDSGWLVSAVVIFAGGVWVVIRAWQARRLNR